MGVFVSIVFSQIALDVKSACNKCEMLKYLQHIEIEYAMTPKGYTLN